MNKNPTFLTKKKTPVALDGRKNQTEGQNRQEKTTDKTRDSTRENPEMNELSRSVRFTCNR